MMCCNCVCVCVVVVVVVCVCARVYLQASNLGLVVVGGGTQRAGSGVQEGSGDVMHPCTLVHTSWWWLCVRTRVRARCVVDEYHGSRLPHPQSAYKLTLTLLPPLQHRWSEDEKGNEYMILELVRLGSLDKLLLAYGHAIRSRSKLNMCEQICSAMCELASEGVLHR